MASSAAPARPVHFARLEFTEVLRRRRMVRTYADRPVPRHLVEHVLDAGLRAPSAGFSQGWAFVVLEGASETAPFWELTARSPEPPRTGGRLERLRAAPVIIIPLAHRAAYLARYAEDDKAGLGLDQEDAWPVPYWQVDTAFASMAMLLAATDSGLGALFFGIFHGEAALLAHLGVPDGLRPIGAIALGWPADTDERSPSLARGRRDRSTTVHFGRWRGTGLSAMTPCPPA
jgi:nitroreductase